MQPTSMTETPTGFRLECTLPATNVPMSGERRISRKTPALTIVEEWSRALVGVGATMAPSSQVWKGICAAFVSAAKESRPSGSIAKLGLMRPMLTKRSSSMMPTVEPV